MEKVTLLRLYQLKLFCLVGAFAAMIFLSLFLGLPLPYSALAWVIISLALEVFVLGKSEIQINSFVPDKKQSVSQVEVKEHFLTMRKAKITLLAMGFLGMFLNFSFDAIYIPLAIAWTFYAYAVKDKKVASALFDSQRATLTSFDPFEDLSRSRSDWLSDSDPYKPGSSAYMLRKSAENSAYFARLSDNDPYNAGSSAYIHRISSEQSFLSDWSSDAGSYSHNTSISHSYNSDPY